jgi:hypothetical protein
MMKIGLRCGITGETAGLELGKWGFLAIKKLSTGAATGVYPIIGVR